MVDFDYEWFDVHSLAVVAVAYHDAWAVPSVHVANQSVSLKFYY